jgi:myo-inositol-1(or 4)-monophosphatase
MNLTKATELAVHSVRLVGSMMRRNLSVPKKTKLVTRHDIKLELDVRAQKLIEKILRAAFPSVSVVGEEGCVGPGGGDYRWVVDPIDGTVNFTYGIPHACVSIALQQRVEPGSPGAYEDGYRTVLGVVYDPFCDELWTAIHGRRARLNGRIIQVSRRRKLAEAIVTLNFAKTRKMIEATMPFLIQLAPRVRKIRITGAGAMALTYVASGRFDLYVERSIRLWDIAAGGLIVECAGGEFRREMIPGEYAYRVMASNGLLRRQLHVPAWLESQPP